MQHRIVVVATFSVLAASIWLISGPPPIRKSDQEDAWIADWRFEPLYPERFDEASFGPEKRSRYVQGFALRVISEEFPIRAGMSVEVMDRAIHENERRNANREYEECYNLNFERRSITHESGWVNFWVNGKSLFHCDIVVRAGTVQSVWIMPGNAEWFTGIYYCASGRGPHDGPDTLW